METKVAEHFVVEHIVGGFIYKAVYTIGDPRFDTPIQHLAPLNEELHKVVMPMIFKGKGAIESAHLLDAMATFTSEDVFTTNPVQIFMYLLRLRSADIIRKFAK